MSVQGGKGGSAQTTQPTVQPALQVPGATTTQPAVQPALQVPGKTTTQPAVQATQAKGGVPTNPFMQASQGLQGSYQAILQAMQSNAASNPALTDAAKGVAQQIPGTAKMQSSNYTAAMQNDPAAISSLLKQYMNPYTSEVINNTTRSMQQDRNAALTQNKSNAAAAGAFGGSRHGIVDAVTNAEVNQNIGDMAAQLRNQGFNTAANLAGQDISNQMTVAGQNQNALNSQRQYNATNRFNANQQNAAWMNDTAQQNAALRAQNAMQNAQFAQQSKLANQASKNAFQQNQFGNTMQGANALGNLSQISFGMGNTLNQNQMQQGALSQQLLQSILGAGSDMFSQYANQPQDLLNLRLASLGMNPLGKAGTTTQTQSGGGTNMAGDLLGALGNMFSFAPIVL